MSDAVARKPRFRPLRWLGGLLLALAALALVTVWAIDTGPGHRFLTDRIAALPIKSGLRVRIGRIDGSIWNRATIRDLRLYDLKGQFLEAPEVRLDWNPAAWMRNVLDVNILSAPLVTLDRLPVLRASAEPAVLPSFDLRVGRLAITRLELGAGITGGRVRAGRMTGSADIRDGRAMVMLDAAVTRAGKAGGDNLRVRLDARPDSDRFDVDVALDAPAGSVAGRWLGTPRPVTLRIDGDGRWTDWRGRAQATLSGRSIGQLALRAAAGRYALDGRVAPAPFLSGKLQRLSSPSVTVRGSGTLVDRRLAGEIKLRSRALMLDAKGAVDLTRSRFGAMAVRADLLQPAALFPNMTGQKISLKLTLDGPFKTAAFDYLATAPRLAFDATGFEDVRAAGRGRLSPNGPVAVPIRLTARRVTGVGDVAGGILANLSVAGQVQATARTLTGTGLAFDSDKLKGKLALRVDLVTGRYDVTISGQLRRYLIPGLGIVEVTSDLSVVPDPSGRGTRVEGRGQGRVLRLDNAFLAGLAGGLPRIDTRLVRDRDGVLRFSDLVLTAPTITIRGTGMRRRDGTFQFAGSGRQARYGAFDIGLDGDISRPRVELLLAAPADPLGLAAVRATLLPDAGGYQWQAAGGSTLGPFAGRGRIDLPSGAPAVVRVAALNVSGTTAVGALRSDPGGFTGVLTTAGGGIDGRLLFSPVGDVQRIEMHLGFAAARLAMAVPVELRRGKLDAVLLLDPAGTSVEATATAAGARRGDVSIARIAGNARLRGGRGTVRASVAGSRGRAFEFQTVAQVAPDRIELIGSGTLDRKAIRLSRPAVLTREGDGWRVAPTALTYDGGTATVGGRFGAGDATVDATLARMPMSLLDLAFPQLGVSGLASGQLTYRLPGGGQVPTGRADLRIRGLTRSGLVLSSRPIDVGLAMVLDARGLAARSVVASGGAIIGRAQGRIGPLGGGAGLAERLRAAPIFAQLRYTGPADTLWRLTGVETIDLSGPVAVGADIGGRVSSPVIRGSIRTSGARLESAVTGTVIQGIVAAGRFDGSRLVMDSFRGATPRGGTVAGRATFDLAAARGFGMDIALDANKAVLLARDDIGATVTGPLRIQSDGVGGTISGTVKLDQSRYRLGRAAAASIPRLNVREINRPDDVSDLPAATAPWKLDLKADARTRMIVSGLGLDSEWRAQLGIAGTVDSPQITGRADLLRGNYEFAGRRFDIDRGSIRFQGETPVDPVLDIVANANIQGLSASIRVSGTGLRPQVDFSSVPALPEDELLSRLLFGSSITTLSAPEALQLAAAVASLRADGGGGMNLNPINAIRRAAGLDRLRILPADVATGQGTSVAAGKYIGRRTYLEVITDGQGYSATRLEYRITRWLSLLSTISTVGRQSANVRVSKDY
ncbi:translocation/assembly module TamB domain-containing protein [Sphingomonas arantia]|uniref:Translocation/assembly module TamB domain-containing protein n=1 Tax=Sphingomonas arantia TaxID=1460676 RepID=A0ABW4U0Q5_9SPHN